jgi:hypothetical protein
LCYGRSCVVPTKAGIQKLSASRQRFELLDTCAGMTSEDDDASQLEKRHRNVPSHAERTLRHVPICVMRVNRF